MNRRPPQIVGRTSSWIDPDSPDAALAARSARALKQELDWASFLGLQAVVVTPPPRLHAAVNFSRLLNAALEGLSNMALWVQLPLAAPAAPARRRRQSAAGAGAGGGVAGGGAGEGAQEQQAAAAAEGEQQRDPWDDWQQLFALCERR